MFPLLAIVAFTFALPTAFAFSWSYPVAPRQCSNVTINVTDISDVVFPLKVLIVPVGPSPLTNEVRKVMEVFFPANGTTVSFQLPYPSGSQFVGLVSDASGYKGKASTYTVGSSDSNATCFDTTKKAEPSFTFSLSPTDVAECQDVRIYWSPGSVQGTPSFISVIPDISFRPIPVGKIDNQTGLGRGFTWTPPVRATSNLIIVAGDNRGAGAGGFISTIVNPGNPNRDATGECPAPTASVSTTASTATSTSKGNATNTTVSPITIGLVVGAVLAILALVLFIFHLRHRKKAEQPQTLFPYTPPSLPIPAPNYLGAKQSLGSSPVAVSPSSRMSQELPPQYVADPYGRL